MQQKFGPYLLLGHMLRGAARGQAENQAERGFGLSLTRAGKGGAQADEEQLLDMRRRATVGGQLFLGETVGGNAQHDMR